MSLGPGYQLLQSIPLLSGLPAITGPQKFVTQSQYHFDVIPPSITNSEPVTYFDSSEARYKTA